MQQIFQIRTAYRGFKSSFRLSDVSKDFFKSKYINTIFTDLNTCKVGNTFDDLYEVIDYYNYNDIKVEHKRSNIVDMFEPFWRDAINNFREEYKDSHLISKIQLILLFLLIFILIAQLVY